MNQTLLTAGQFAKLARTTKRTVLWYDQKGILKPRHVDDSGYRYYRPQQILDWQSISLMRKLGFSIEEIATLLSRGSTMRQLFEQQRGALQNQIGQLQRMLADTNRYYENLQANGTLVQPELKDVPSFDMYFVARQGPYAKLAAYHNELIDSFAVLPDGCVYLTAFMTATYQPAKADMKIGVVCAPGMRLKPGAEVQRETVPAYQALSCVHQGSTTLLSLLWQELGKYRRKQHLASGTGLPFADVEFYTPDTSEYPDPVDSLTTELHMPVITKG
ncbi:MAG TPA: MerR family transcriptional regulator [Candidatus Saccharimonadales bacterium]|nr:MerR family transcriptional regulator [Candidatus Saccharimonadales bacterium]